MQKSYYYRVLEDHVLHGSTPHLSDQHVTPADHLSFLLAAVVDSSDDAILSLDLNGNIRSWNEGARRMYGYGADEIAGRSILQLISEELHPEEMEILARVKKGERIDQRETLRADKAGNPIEVSVSISPIWNKLGQVVGASTVERNIADRRRMEKFLIQSEQLAATGRLAAAIAHEINNPLESVLNLIFLARQNTPKDENAYGYLVTAERELERVAHIARQALGYCRDTNTPSEVYLHDLIENVLTVYQSKLLTKAISVERNFTDPLRVRLRTGEMIQVFSNVIANAIEAMPNGGTLSVSVCTTFDGVEAVIRDQGTGILPENLERIFEPFFTTKGNLGTGIGLWVTKQLVERQGGQIGVSSSTEPQMRGTSVSIHIPWATARARLPCEPAPVAEPNGIESEMNW